MSPTLYFELAKATVETVYMVCVSTGFSVLFGLPLGVLLFSSRSLQRHPLLANSISVFINSSRSIPFIILLVALIPVTRFIVGSSIGINAALVPLTLGAIPFYARLVNDALHNLPKGLIEAGTAMGASRVQLIGRILIPEATSSLIQATTVTAIALVNYSAMAGTIGGGGLGDLAIRYGYQRFDTTVMLATVLILIVLVQVIQMIGDKLAKI